jgi:uncharacterized caspase-like protein
MLQRFCVFITILFVVKLLWAQGAYDFGRYHALVIGNQNYKYLQNLNTPTNDAREVEYILKNKYGFKTTILIDATRSEIITVLVRLRKSLTIHDNLLIYYAGHGYLDETTDTGYWQPIDAETNSDVHWIPTTTITRYLSAIEAKHVIVIADSCYSGSLLTRSSGSSLPTGVEREIWMQRMNELNSRTALTSGGLEVVLDSGGGGHSVFARAFIDVLQESNEIFDGSRLFDELKGKVVLKASQTPRYANIRTLKSDNGDFIFVPNNYVETAEKNVSYKKIRQGSMFRTNQAKASCEGPINDQDFECLLQGD